MDNHVLEASELILNEDGSVYHLDLKPGEVAQTIITVGDPDRVDLVSRYMDEIYLTKQKREFKTITGRIGNRDISIISTGIGTDNIDIVFNELDVLFNVDFASRSIKPVLTSLNFLRIGTTGCIQPQIPIDSFLVSAMAIETENILSKYSFQENDLEQQINHVLSGILNNHQISVVQGHKDWLANISSKYYTGISYTAGGFYAPQGRSLRIKSKIDQQTLQQLRDFRLNNLMVTNFEMETAGIYGMSKLLGHKAISFNAILANRANKTFSTTPAKTVKKLIENVLEQLDLLV